MNEPTTAPPRRKSSRLRTFTILAAILLAGGVAWWLFVEARQTSTGSDSASSVPTYPVEREDLTVTVAAGGTIQAIDTTEVECQVEGQTQILEIVDEGTILTEEDVKNNRIIAKLDSSSMEDKAQQQEIQVANAEAAYKSAEENLNIQKQENQSNISQAELNVEFARMDLEKYVGKTLAAKIIEGGVKYDSIDENSRLGGEAEVKKNSLTSEINLAEEKVTRAEDTLKWTKKLVKKGYVNRNEQDADELQLKTRKSNLQQAKANRHLFLEYTLPKKVEQYASDLKEAKRELARVNARARSQLAQAKSDLRTKKSTYEIKKKRLEELETMINHCTIEAPRPGLVVYASTAEGRHRRSNPIEEGRKLRQGETIITIPDLETMAAEIDISEGDIKSVSRGQPATVSVEAIPDQTWDGTVAKVSSMASQQDRFGPDVRVYETVVKLEGRVTDLKPGMSTTAEIHVADLDDVLAVPMQAVTTYQGNRVVWVSDGGKLRLKQVKTGHFSDTKVEIQAGLAEGEKVLLASPDVAPANAEMVKLPEEDRR